MLAGANHRLVVIVTGAWEYASGVEPLASLDVRCVAAVGQLDVHLSVDSVFNLSELLCGEQSAVFLRLHEFDISMFLDKISR